MSESTHLRDLTAIENAGPAELKELVDKDVLGARPLIEAALARKPDLIHLWEAYVWTFVSVSDMPMVVDTARRALAHGISANLYLWLGVAHLHLGENDKALVALDQATSLNRSGLIADALGRCLHRLGRIDEAIAVLDRAVRQPTEREPLLFACERGLIYALRDKGRWREADVAARDLIARFKDNPARVASTVMHYDMVYPYHRWSAFFNKSGLARAFAAFHATRSGEPTFWPESFDLPEDRAVLVSFRNACPADQVFIVKPPNLFGGRGIRLTRTLDAIGTEPCVVQRYIDRPYLLDGRKFHVRLYVIVTSCAPLRAYVYREGIVRIAPEPYSVTEASLSRPAVHVTNTALHAGHPDLRIGTDPNVEDFGNVWSLSAALARMAAEGLERETMWSRLSQFVARFLSVVAASGVFSHQVAEHTRYCFPPSLFGLDVLIDRDGRPWLLECQRNPAMTGSALVNRINAELFRTAFRMSVFGLLDDLDDRPGPLDEVESRTALEAVKERLLCGRFEPLSVAA